jgi:cap3/cap4 methyltransferase
MTDSGASPAGDRKRVRDAESGGGDFFSLGEGPSVLHYDGSVPVFLDSSFPRAAYRSRGQCVKSAVHWGQRKLFMSELQLLVLFAEPRTPYWIVYVGAAPGSHLLFLDSLFPHCGHTWELVDPGAYDQRLISKRPKNFTLRNEYFNNGCAYELLQRRMQRGGCPALAALHSHLVTVHNETSKERMATAGDNPEHARTADIPVMYEPPVELPPATRLLLYVAAARTKMLFLSDIRSGREDHGNFEAHVEENSRAQEAWVDIINPSYAMLKFRLPYSFTSRYSFELKRQVVTPSAGPPATVHCGGQILFPLWTRPTSTETRLVVPEFAPKRLYDHKLYEDQMFFFNSVMRERVHFNLHPSFGTRSAATAFPTGDYLDQRFDGAAELSLLQQYISGIRGQPEGGEALRRRVAALAQQITDAIGGSFDRAVANRDAIHVKKGERAGWQEETQRRLEAAAAHRALPIWWRDAASEEVAAAPYYWRLHALLDPQREMPMSSLPPGGCH